MTLDKKSVFQGRNDVFWARIPRLHCIYCILYWIKFAKLQFRAKTLHLTQKLLSMNPDIFRLCIVIVYILQISPHFMICLPLFALYSAHLNMPDFFNNSEEKKIDFFIIFPSLEPRRSSMSKNLKEFLPATKAEWKKEFYSNQFTNLLKGVAC